MLDVEGILTTEVAESITQEIRQTADHLWEHIVIAYQGRAWEVLGYDSWDAYCEEEFKSLKVRLPRQERQEVIQSLRDSGLSLRAIAAAAGVDKRTVSRDLAGNGNLTPDVITTETSPESRNITGVNGKKYRPRKDFSDSFWTVAYDLGRLGVRINKLAGDSRFEGSRERIKEASLPDLRKLRTVLNDVIAKLEGALK